ncbi:MAG: DUF87 domain-containing protein [Desulforudis sp.]|nr:MAG: DUF87 domain-containing protein [Desulforudis sp.]
MDEDLLARFGKRLGDMLCPDPFTPNPSANDVDGQVRLGKVRQTGVPFGLNLDELGEHTLITGRAGSGKTTLIYLIIAHLLSYKIPFWAFDFKQDYRHLARSNKVLVFDWKNFRFNPLRPPKGTDPEIWMQAFINVFCQSYWLLSGSKAVIFEHVDKLYREYGVIDGGKVFPTMLDLLESLEGHKLERKYGREAGFFESAHNRVSECLLSLKNLLDCDQGFPIEELLEQNVVFELQGMLAENQSFLLTIILRYVFQYRLSNEQRSGLKHVFLFDEAKSAYSKKREFTKELGVAEIAQFTSMIREFGEGLVVADQMPTELADSIKANVYTVICMSQSGGANILEMSRAMGLKQEQADICRALESDKANQVFEAIVKLNGRWQAPFVIQIIPAQFHKSLSTKELTGFMQPLLEKLGHKLIPRTEYKLIKHAQQKAEDMRRAETREARKEETQRKEAIEGNILIKILTNIRDHPFIDQKTRIQMLGLPSSSSTTDKFFKELVAREFVIIHRIGLGRGRSTRVLYEITDKGKKFASMDKVEIKGKGSFKHKFWQHTIKKYYEDQGYKAEIEKLYGSKNVDVGFTQDGKRVAVEVELTPDNLIENIEKDLDVGCDNIIIVAPNRKAINKYKNLIYPFIISATAINIEFKILTGFLP